MRFAESLRVRFADTDAQGHVFFANYLTFFDEAMTGYLHAIGVPPDRLTALGVDPVYVDAQCSYAGSARFGDTLHIGCRFEDFGHTSFKAVFEVRVDPTEAPIVTGRCVVVMVDRDKVKAPVPQALRDAVAAFEGGDHAGV